jgi:hypothetical protein
LQLQSTDKHAQLKATAMKYATRHANKGLSPDAEVAFKLIAQTVIAKAEREHKAPHTVRLWLSTNDTKIEAELTKAGIVEYQFTDKHTGQKVYDHIVDTEALLEIMPHLVRH